jgi:hypothetical protein
MEFAIKLIYRKSEVGKPRPECKDEFTLLNVPLKDERWLRPNLDYLPEKLPVGG